MCIFSFLKDKVVCCFFSPNGWQLAAGGELENVPEIFIKISAHVYARRGFLVSFEGVSKLFVVEDSRSDDIKMPNSNKRLHFSIL